MVDFRYHLVTIIAIFLALALGIVVGTTQLNGQVLDDLNGRISGLADEKRGLEATVRGQQQVNESDEALLEQVSADAVEGTLVGERVAIISAPNAPSELREQLVPLLLSSGATVGTQVLLRPDLIDPTKAAAVQDVVEANARPGQDATGDAVDLAAQELAEALVVPAGGSASSGSTDIAAGRVLDAFREGDLIDVDGEVQPRATLALLLTGEAVRSADVAGVRARVQALLQLAEALDEQGQGTVISGPVTAVDVGGLIEALRGNEELSSAVSSVDGCDRPQGRIATVFALREQRDGESGQYGTGADNEGPAPALGE